MKFCIALCLCAVLSLTVAQYESDEDAVEQTPLFRQEQQRIQVEDDSLIVDEEQSRQVRQAYENINVDVVNVNGDGGGGGYGGDYSDGGDYGGGFQETNVNIETQSY